MRLANLLVRLDSSVQTPQLLSDTGYSLAAAVPPVTHETQHQKRRRTVIGQRAFDPRGDLAVNCAVTEVVLRELS